MLGLKRDRALTVTEDEVRMLVAEGTRSGVFMPKEREMIEGVLRLADRTARAIMTPRTEVVWLEVNATPADIVAQLDARRLSRFPVCRDTIDNPLGIVHMKDLARAALAGQPIALGEMLLQPLVVLDGTPVLKLLEGFRARGMHMAIVVDEYGATQGVVTLADIIEAVAGTLPEAGGELGSAFVNAPTARGSSTAASASTSSRTGSASRRTARLANVRHGRRLRVVSARPTAARRRHVHGPHGQYEIVDMDGRRIDKLIYRPRVEEDG